MKDTLYKMIFQSRLCHAFLFSRSCIGSSELQANGEKCLNAVFIIQHGEDLHLGFFFKKSVSGRVNINQWLSPSWQRPSSGFEKGISPRSIGLLMNLYPALERLNRPRSLKKFEGTLLASSMSACKGLNILFYREKKEKEQISESIPMFLVKINQMLVEQLLPINNWGSNSTKSGRAALSLQS